MIMITDTRAAEAIEKPKSRLSSVGLTRADWALFAVALFMGALALLSLIDTPQPEAVRVLARLVAPVGLVLAALGLVRSGNALDVTERRVVARVVVDGPTRIARHTDIVLPELQLFTAGHALPQFDVVGREVSGIHPWTA